MRDLAAIEVGKGSSVIEGLIVGSVRRYNRKADQTRRRHN